MNYENVITFLSNNQPFPNEDNLKQETIDKYIECIKYLNDIYADEKCIPLLLNSFGDGILFSIDQEVEPILLKFDKSIVEPYLLKSIYSKNSYQRFWALSYAGEFFSKENIHLLCPFAKDKNETEDNRIAALVSLELLDESLYLECINEMKKDEENKEIIDEIIDIVSD